MTQATFGIDFGTTNSLAAVVLGDQVRSLTNEDERPHPSVLWYRGSDVLVGREARQNLDMNEGGAPPGFVRSPKMSLRRQGPIYVDGRPIDARTAVAEVLKHLKTDAAKGRDRATGYSLERAVMTIPVDFGGHERKALREAARLAGISVVQFVHEPAAALYGHLRAMKEDERNRELARLEGRFVLVFDWGGGTLDLTLCKIQGGAIMQVANDGDNEIGGDEFDSRLRNLFREKHAKQHGLIDVTGLEQAGMAAKLLTQCEIVKIQLSDARRDAENMIVRNYLRADGPAANLVGSVTRLELEEATGDIVARGLGLIDKILDRVRLSRKDIELCLATGGMVNMPVIRNGLTERFLGRVPTLPNGDRIIAEGAAWIAHDGLRLTLSKPIEILVADSSGRGAYHQLVEAGRILPVENQVVTAANTRLYCVDPREGVAVVELAKPVRIGAASPSDPRETLCVASVPVDSQARALVERLDCRLTIDDDYIATVIFRSTGMGVEATANFHNLDFGLALPGSRSENFDDDPSKGKNTKTRGTSSVAAAATSNVTQRTNVALDQNGEMTHRELWRFVPGDIVTTWEDAYFDTRTGQASPRQAEERSFYIPCSRCGRLESRIRSDGPVAECRGRPCGRSLTPASAMPERQPSAP